MKFFPHFFLFKSFKSLLNLLQSCFCFLFLYFYFILLYNTVLVLLYINMNLPRVYMSSQSWTPLLPPLVLFLCLFKLVFYEPYSKSAVSFFCMRICSFPNIICWRNCSHFLVLSAFRISFDDICEVLFLDHFVPLVHESVYMPKAHFFIAIAL